MELASGIRWDLETRDLGRAHREISRRLKPYSMEAGAGNKYRARLCHRRLREVDLTVIEYGGAVAIDAGRMKDFWLLHVPLRGHYLAHSGGHTRRVASGVAHLVHPQVRIAMECSADFRLLVLRFNETRLAGTGLQRRRHPGVDEYGDVLSLQQGNGRSLGRAIDYVAGELTQGELLKQRPNLTPGLEDLLLSSLALTLDGDPDSSRSPLLSHVKRAEKYMLENLASDLDLNEVVAASRVSARTLFRGFQAIHGQGPIGWARDQRLERVHADLLNALGKPHIYEIALRWGFTHFGRFCTAYRARYGQTPSESLRMRS